MIKGICRLCGEDTDLSFEHVPPKTASNKNTKYTSVDFEDYIKIKDPLKEKPKGQIKQGGIGYNSFCKRCNSFLGSHYVPAYKRWVQGGFEILKDTEFYPHKYLIKEVEPLKILKHIISMFLAINREWYLKSYPELAEFVQNPESKILPNRYRVFTYLTRAEKLRYMHHVVHGSLSTGVAIKCSEIAFPPYGCVITMDFDGDLKYLNDITKFKEFDFNSTTDLTINMFQLPTYMPFPLDYRSKEKVEVDIKKGIETSKRMEKEQESSKPDKKTAANNS